MNCKRSLSQRSDLFISSIIISQFHVVCNRCIDYVRKQKVITKAITQLQPSEEDFEYFDELAFAEMVPQVIDHIEEPTNMSTILKKYYLQGKKHKEIANELSTTPDAVRMQKTRGLNYYTKSCCFL